MNGLGWCSCIGVPHSCKAYASKPFSGWCDFAENETQDPEKHFLNYVCQITQTFYATEYDSEGAVVDTWSDSGYQIITVTRNRYTNNQTVSFGAVNGLYWGALNYFHIYGDPPPIRGYVWARETDNYAVIGSGNFINYTAFISEIGVIDPVYLSTLDGFVIVKPDYFTAPDPWINPVVEGYRQDKIKCNFVTFNNGVDGGDGYVQYIVEIYAAEVLSSTYAISTCNTDQAALISANTLSRLQTRARETDFTVSYCGYDNAGAIVFDDDYDGTGLGAGFYPVAPYDGLTGIPSDPTLAWSDTTLYHLADQLSTVGSYDAANISLPRIASPADMVVNACVESKTVFIEAAVSYDLMTYDWEQNSQVGSLTDTTTFAGVEGHETDIIATFETVKSLVETPS